MRVIERTHHIDIDIIDGGEFILPMIRKAYPDIEVSDDDGYIDAKSSEAYKEGKRFMQEFPGMRLYAYRARRGLTQKQLADMSGVRREAISMIENGKRPIGVNLAKKLAGPLSVDYLSLL